MLTRFFLFWATLFAVSACVLAAETYFEVIDNEGKSYFGTIADLDRTQIVINVRETLQTIAIEKLVKIRNLAPSPYEGKASGTASSQNTSDAGYPGRYQPPTPIPSGRNVNDQGLADEIVRKLQSNEQTIQKTFPGSVVAIELKDGSRLTASSFAVEKDQGVCRLLEQESDSSIPLTDIAAVRFAVRSLPEVINPPADWLRLAVPNAEGDRLVVGNPGAFDVYVGILGNTSSETISFTIDGEELPIPRRRVFGLVLHGEAPSAAADAPLATLTLWTGTRGTISDIRLNDENELSWQTTTGLTIAVPLSTVNEIDFGGKGVTYLVDCERVRHEFSLPFASETNPEQMKLLQTFYESRTKESREMILDGILFERGITLLGKTSLEYRLPKPFAVLRGVVGIEDQFRPHASAQLQILADTQNLGTWELRGDTGSQQISLNLPQNCQLITIIVEPLPSLDGATVLSIANAKLVE